MSKVSHDLDSMMVALRQSDEIGCRGAHRDSNGQWVACSSPAELKQVSKLKKQPLAENVRIRDRKGSNKLSGRWEPLGQRGVMGISTLDGGGLVSAAIGKALKENDLEVYTDIETARQRARQLSCIGVARRYTASGKEVWTPCTNMSDLSRLAGLTSLGRRGQRLTAERTITDALKRQQRRQRRSTKDARKSQFGVKKLSGRLGGGLRIPPAGMVFVDVSGAIDADRDGIVNEGRPDERPIIPTRMITEAIAAALPSQSMSSSTGLSSLSIEKPSPKLVPATAKRPAQVAATELYDRLSDEDKQFMKRLPRNIGYGSEIPERLVFASSPDLRARIEENNIQGAIAGMRSLSASTPTGGRAMSDKVMERIDSEHFGKDEPTIYFVGGTMGAGKSTIVSNFSDATGMPQLNAAAHIDPDEIKTALPGWNGGKGASAVHAQSRFVTDKILERALGSAVDIVIQGTGKRNEHLHLARQNKYRTVGHYVWVPSDMSSARISDRVKQGGAKVDPYLGPLIASELRDLTHRQVTSGLLDEFYLWDNSGEQPTLIASFDGESIFTINNEDAFYDFFGKYGGDRVKAHWAAIGSAQKRAGMKSSGKQEPSITQLDLGESMARRIVVSGYNKDKPLTLDLLGDAPLRHAAMDGIHLKNGSSFRGLNAPFMTGERLHAPGVDFSGSTLFAASLSRANLFRARLKVDDATGRPTDLRFAHLSFLYAPGADFSGSLLRGASLTGANLQGSVLRNADLRDIDLVGTDLRGADLSGAKLDEGSLDSAVLDALTILPDGSFAKPSNSAPKLNSPTERPLPPAPIPLSIKADDESRSVFAFVINGRLIALNSSLDASGARLERRDMRDSQLVGATFENSELEAASLDRSAITDTSFVGAMMERTRLSRSKLTRVDLRGIFGRQAKLNGTELTSVDLRGSDLREASLENAVAIGRVDLRGADLRGAFLAGADLRRAIIDQSTKTDGLRVDRRTKMPPNFDMKRIGVPMRSKSTRDFDDYLLAEVVEDARYSKQSGAQVDELESSGLTTQHRFIRGQIVTRALARLLARDIDNFGPQLTDREHRNINQRLMMARDLYSQAQQAREVSLALENLNGIENISQIEYRAYVDNSLFGSLRDDLFDLNSALQREFPPNLNDMNDMLTFIESRKEANRNANITSSSLQRLSDRLSGAEGIAIPTPGSRQGRAEKAMRDKVVPLLVARSTSTDGMRATSRSREIADATTKALIESLESAEADKWTRPWQLHMGIPKNAVTGKYYRGWNVFWLAMAQKASGHDLPVWATYKQWSQIGGQVRKGQKGTVAIKWSLALKKLDDGSYETSERLVPYAFSLFNLDQVDGVDRAQFDVQRLPESARVERMETILGEMGIKTTGANSDMAYYDPVNNVINMPPFAAFADAKSYYSTLAHEAVHWTGHGSRLDRSNMHKFGTPEYAYEELVAEIGSAMLMSLMDLEPEPQPRHAQYIKGWLTLLKEQPNALHQAILDAQKAIDFLIELSPTLKRDMTPIEPDGDSFGEPSLVDALEQTADRSADLAMRSATKQERLNERQTMQVFTGQADKTPLSINEVAEMSDQKLSMLVTEDRMNGLTANELAAKYHLSQSQVLLAVREFLVMLESGTLPDESSKEPTLVTRREGISQRVRISQLSRQEAETSLQFVRREIQRAKNARELRHQTNIERLILSRLDVLDRSDITE